MSTITFGLGIRAAAGPDDDPVGDAVAAEGAGYDFVSTSDHPGLAQPSFESWTMLAWIAASTSRIQVASRVLGVPLRNPALVAKMAESFQRLSGGRLILGLGAGSGDDEFRAFGLPALSAREKFDGLEDALRIIRGMWSQAAFSHRGDVHSTEAAELEPKPDQRIPIWLGMFGPRGLELTGRLADGWIPSLGYRPEEELPDMVAAVVASAVAAGRDPEDVTRALNVQVHLDPGPAAIEADVIAGSGEQITERLLELTAMGFNAFNLMVPADDRRGHAARLAEVVMPAVRAGA
jgi:alkanesulfonate monooxygenase SsuD/methylene tetrahydromethanopterin reductase-like flavin-dependent oxidoreductase (luciferase family)